MKQEVKRWMKQANEELDTAKINFEAKKYFSAAFWCQQSVEKAFKALLIYKTNKFPKIHDLTKLAKLNEAPLNILELCAKINPAYTVSRYPDSPKKYTRKECKQIISYCQEVLKWIKKNLNS
ncbi:HEPN domain-containing protein [Candidatus Woesearchaeota archaeon]|nr:HEPN domain-containing protein [Candidatus Woesearchaeota archaeon]